MPSRNVLKQDIAESYYHVYTRGINKTKIFHDSSDYDTYISLLKRYLSSDITTNKVGVPYASFKGKIEVLCYCLMPNHVHLLVYQIEEHTMTKLLRAVITSYVRYYNTKYARTGPLFESCYKGSRIDNDSYLTHISRYILMNPRDWKNYAYSSVHFMFDAGRADWIQPGRIEEQFKDRADYLNFLADYEGQKEILEEIKHELANVA